MNEIDEKTKKTELDTSQIQKINEQKSHREGHWNKEGVKEHQSAKDVSAETKSKTIESRDVRESKDRVATDHTPIIPPSFEILQKELNRSYEARNEKGRFAVEGKTPVFYSGEAKSSEYRKDSKDETTKGAIHSGELAKKHTIDHSSTYRMEDTKGGQELEKLEKWVKSDFYSPTEKKDLNQMMTILWNDASRRFADHGSKTGSSVGYVETSKIERNYQMFERKEIEKNKNHIHLTDSSLKENGKPAELDQIPNTLLDKDGKMHQT